MISNMNPNFLIASVAIFFSISMIITVAVANEDVNDLIEKGFEAERETQYDLAMSYFDRVLEIEPDNLKALNANGVISAKTEKYDDALLYFDKILEIEPDNVDVLNNKAALFLELGKQDNAMQHIDRILEIEPDNVQALYTKGEIHLKKKDYEQALSYLDRVLQIEPDNLKALNAKGSLFQVQGEYEKALTFFDRILEIDPDYVPALFGKGGVLGEMGDIELSVYHFVKALRLEPDFLGAKINLHQSLKSLPIIKIEGNVMIHALDSDGKLFMYQEIPTLVMHPLNITNEFLDIIPVKEVITRDGKNYEVLELRQVAPIIFHTSLSEVQLHPEGFEELPVVLGSSNGFLVQPGDTLHTLWTIYRPVN